MKRKKTILRLVELSRDIRRHNFFYYIQSKPKISDTEYDKLLVELIKLEERYPELKIISSPTRQIGQPPQNNFSKVVHYQLMFSLESSIDNTVVEKLLNDLEMINITNLYVLVQPKIDGLPVELIYEYGIFKEGATRGDGEIGEDITSNLRTITVIPSLLNGCFEPLVVVRGEIYMEREDFDNFNRFLIEQGQEIFANPRNAAAGSLRHINADITAERSLNFFPFELVTALEHGVTSDFQAFNLLFFWGFPVNSEYIHRGYGLEFVETIYANYKAKRDYLSFEVDGIVIKIDSLIIRQYMRERLRSIRWGVAWKFRSRQEITTVRSIVNQVGRTGKITPIALLMPVDVNGITVSRATLHNYKYINKLKVSVGDIVRVKLAGDIIPQVVKIERKCILRDYRIEPPFRCPVCGSIIVAKNINYFCPNIIGCSAQLQAAVCHYVSRRAMNIKGLGNSRVAKLIVLKFLIDLPSLYYLSGYRSRLINLEGWDRLSIDAILGGIEATRKCPLDRFLFSLGIPSVGENIACILANYFNSVKLLLNSNEKELADIPGVGLVIAKQILNFFAQPQCVNIIKRLNYEVRPYW